MNAKERRPFGIFELKSDQLKMSLGNVGSQPTELIGEIESGTLINLKLTR